MSTKQQIVVIGGGIAGVSAAAALQRHAGQPQVRLIEAESTMAYHTTGRSAAQLIENYGTDPIRSLTKASLGYFHTPPADLVDGPLVETRGLLTVASTSQAAHFEAELAAGQRANPNISEITPAQAADHFPALRAEVFDRALWEPDSQSIDVAGLHQSFVRAFRAAGGIIDLERRAVALKRANQLWHITTTDGSGPSPLTADVVVNAAGAWGDQVAAMAGLGPVGLQPLRRTAFMVKSAMPGSDRWPLTADVEHRWYIKPDGSQFLCSPADETPSEPVDARPEEIDVAQAIDAINNATTLNIRSVQSSWAGLRTFAPDRVMVIGPEPTESSFIWCVGQGGTGIQTAPGAGALVAEVTLGAELPPSLTEAGVTAEAFSPQRFR